MSKCKRCNRLHITKYRYCDTCAPYARIEKLRAENAKLIKALHLITNLAHPQNPEIFKAAMDALGLEANDE